MFHEETLRRLAHESLKAQSQATDELMDDTAHLSAELRQAWAGLLSSAASAEESERSVIDPILAAFAHEPLWHDYLKTHLEDENRHQEMLKSYVFQTFDYVKTHKTFTDLVVYQGIFWVVRRLSFKRPLPIITAILFYELFAEEWYGLLVQKAGQDQLPALQRMFQRIEKDEVRHRMGLKILLSSWKTQGQRIDHWDRFLARALLWVVRMDVNSARWAFYNRSLRRRLLHLGFDADQLYQNAKQYADLAYRQLAH